MTPAIFDGTRNLKRGRLLDISRMLEVDVFEKVDQTFQRVVVPVWSIARGAAKGTKRGRDENRSQTRAQSQPHL